LFEKFFPGNPHLVGKFVQALPEKVVSMAALQNHLMLYKENPEAAIVEATKLVPAGIRS